MTPCFGYTRVSTVKQGEGVSLEAQKDAITHYAERNGLSVTKWFEEKETAAKTGRPVFNALVKDLKSGKARGFITHKIDRSARNFRDWALIGELADAGISIHFATETLDFSSRGGRLAADVQAVVAADCIRNLRDETIKGLKGRLKQGLYPYKAPLGYLNTGGGNVKTPDPARRQLVQEMFELYATGNYSLRTLTAEMTERGLTNWTGNPLSRSSIEKLLYNPFFCGVIKIKRTGETYQGAHEPLISVSLFERVQAIKSGRYGKKTTKHHHSYRRLFPCNICGKSLIGELQKGKVYYRCQTKSCPVTSWREDALEREVFRFLKEALLPESTLDRLSSDMRVSFDQQLGGNAAIAELTMQIAQANTRLENLTDAVIDQIIDQETFKGRREQALLNIRKLEEKRNKLNKNKSDLRYLLKFLELAKNLTWLYKTANPAEKRLLLELSTSNRNVDEKRIAFEPSFWFRAVTKPMAVPKGCHSKATSRTMSEILNEYIVQEIREDIDPTLPELVQQLEDIFAKYGNFEGKPDQES